MVIWGFHGFRVLDGFMGFEMFRWFQMVFVVLHGSMCFREFFVVLQSLRG